MARGRSSSRRQHQTGEVATKHSHIGYVVGLFVYSVGSTAQHRGTKTCIAMSNTSLYMNVYSQFIFHGSLLQNISLYLLFIAAAMLHTVRLYKLECI